MCRQAIYYKLLMATLLAGLLGTSPLVVTAGDGIRVHRANQFHQLEKRLHARDNAAHRYYRHGYDSRYRKKGRYSRQPVVPDSRFPNSYREYNYQLQRQYRKRRGP